MAVVKQGWRFLVVQVVWPDEDEHVTLTVIGEEDSEPLILDDILATGIAMGWNQPVTRSDNEIDFATIDYPEGITFNIDGNDYGLDFAHQAFSVFLVMALEKAVERFEKDESARSTGDSAQPSGG